MSTGEMLCVLHISVDLLEADFCAAATCAGYLLTSSDYSLTRHGHLLKLDAHALCFLMREIRRTDRRSPFRSPNARAAPTCT